jgi:hypothetical protein
MSHNLIFFPVGNGDMTLIVLISGLTILIDINIRTAADNPKDPLPDVAAKLRKHLKCDTKGRPYVDIFVLTHPDADHCRGLMRHFHLGSPDTYSPADNKILVHEIWSSPIVFRRASKILTLGDDAQAFAKEARRRVQLFRDQGVGCAGDRIQIMSEDENGKTDDLQAILVNLGELIPSFNGQAETGLTARLLGPLPKFDDEEKEASLAKNRSSIILKFEFKINGIVVGRLLIAGDAEVAVWERLWQDYGDTDWLKYDILLAPHHCSWHSLSYDSSSDLGGSAEVSVTARHALAQALQGAVIVASSNPIKAEEADPPSDRAKLEYVAIIKAVSGRFFCTGEYPKEDNPDQMVFEIGQSGPRLPSILVIPGSSNGCSVGKQPLSHG